MARLQLLLLALWTFIAISANFSHVSAEKDEPKKGGKKGGGKEKKEAPPKPAMFVQLNINNIILRDFNGTAKVIPENKNEKETKKEEKEPAETAEKTTTEKPETAEKTTTEKPGSDESKKEEKAENDNKEEKEAKESTETNSEPEDSKGGKSKNSKCPPKPIDCESLLVDCGVTESGVHRIYPRSRVNVWEDGFDVFCDMKTDGGGWTVFQTRDDFGDSPDFFDKDWYNYKDGFGELDHEFYIGNDKIFALSNQRPSVLRFDLSDFEGGKGFATYKKFFIDDEDEGYRIHLGTYSGTVGDSFTAHNSMKFTTKDRHNDNNKSQNCAQLYKGGWWFNNCHTVNLHGLYLKGPHQSYANGVNWYLYKGFHYSLKRTEMKLRSINFKKPQR